ncbi:TetR/AcrR family transcriptional regulator [Actinomadura nitritigenes]|uniref:TetR/AcrR family transcriptional regulator n=1 Tax=Actinomadura nitritigenes TaxID=134602 RepID=A0ABS3R921_9ACTN|nr:TetR/AcrR family transcriptional regulator [Actinomadura nitritigenes]MBO2442695.1 TetR/AcrR family transcriptional regulator [Actinomadura nitritigenes]
MTAALAVDRLLDDGSGRRPRADARRNVARLVVAARQAVVEGGEITAHEIARRAGVGIGTFYRRVGSLEALLDAVLTEVLEEIIAKGDEGLADPDPWAGFTRFALSYIHLRNELCDVNKRLGDVLDHSRAELRHRIRLLVERAQQAGVMRTDATWEDVAFLMVAASSTGPHTLGLQADTRQWDRNLQVVLDGLRNPDPGPLPGEPPVLDPRPEVP